MRAQVGLDEFKLFEMLKVRFWELYRIEAKKTARNKISIAAWTSEFCSQTWFRKHVLKNEVALAFIVSPPPQEFTRMKTVINRAIDRLTEVFELPLTTVDKDGVEKVNTALIGQMHNISKTLMERVHGGVVQKAQIHTHTTSDKKQIATEAMPDLAQLGNMAEKLAELQAKLKETEKTETKVLEAAFDD